MCIRDRQLVVLPLQSAQPGEVTGDQPALAVLDGLSRHWTVGAQHRSGEGARGKRHRLLPRRVDDTNEGKQLRLYGFEIGVTKRDDEDTRVRFGRLGGVELGDKGAGRLLDELL